MTQFPSNPDLLSKPSHVILGAGALATATAQALIAKGLNVKMVSRSGRPAGPVAGIETVRVDLLDRAATRSCLNGATTLYFCAQPAYHRWPAQFPALQSAAIDLAAEMGCRLIVAENLYGYGPVDRPMHEGMPMRPTTSKGRVRAEMHEALMTAHALRRIRVSVARGSDFFGPHVEGSVVGARAMQAVRDGRTVEVAGDPDMAHSYTYVRDFGTALAMLGTAEDGDGEVWHVPNAPAVTTRRLFEIASHLCGRRSKLRRMSRLEMHLVGLFLPPVRETIEMLYEFEAPFIVDDAKFKQRFGNISTPIEAALADTLLGGLDKG